MSTAAKGLVSFIRDRILAEIEEQLVRLAKALVVAAVVQRAGQAVLAHGTTARRTDTKQEDNEKQGSGQGAPIQSTKAVRTVAMKWISLAVQRAPQTGLRIGQCTQQPGSRAGCMNRWGLLVRSHKGMKACARPMDNSRKGGGGFFLLAGQCVCTGCIPQLSDREARSQQQLQMREAQLWSIQHGEVVSQQVRNRDNMPSSNRELAKIYDWLLQSTAEAHAVVRT